MIRDFSISTNFKHLILLEKDDMCLAKKAALKDIDDHLKRIYGDDYKRCAIYSKHLDTKENRRLNRLTMKKHDKF